MALDDDDMTTAGGGGEGTADGGSNPEGHDGGADGTASEEKAARERPTAARTPRVTTAVPTEPPEASMLSRCVATDTGVFATEYGAANPCSVATPRCPATSAISSHQLRLMS